MSNELQKMLEKEFSSIVGGIYMHPSVLGPFVVLGIDTDDMKWFVQILSLDTFTIARVSVSWKSSIAKDDEVITTKYRNFFSAAWDYVG